MAHEIQVLENEVVGDSKVSLSGTRRLVLLLLALSIVAIAAPLPLRIHAQSPNAVLREHVFETRRLALRFDDTYRRLVAAAREARTPEQVVKAVIALEEEYSLIMDDAFRDAAKLTEEYKAHELDDAPYYELYEQVDKVQDALLVYALEQGRIYVPIIDLFLEGASLEAIRNEVNRPALFDARRNFIAQFNRLARGLNVPLLD